MATGGMANKERGKCGALFNVPYGMVFGSTVTGGRGNQGALFNVSNGMVTKGHVN